MTADQFIISMESATENIAAHLDDALRDCVPLVYSDLEDNFLMAHDPDGNSWPDRKDPKPTHPLLILSGQLAEAATSPDAQGSVCKVSDGELRIGVNKDDGGGGIPGAARHNYGDDPPGILQREFLGLTEESAEKCDDVFADWAIESILATA
jgi:phage gpG-like protein